MTCCKEENTAELARALRERYWKIKCVGAPVWNYVGMVLDTSAESEAEVTMKGFVDELLMWYGVWWKPSGRDEISQYIGATAVPCEESEARSTNRGVIPGD
jgi:hypothetical protein